MCGIFGWNFTRPHPNQQIITTSLAVMNELRGNHGWGWVGFDLEGTLQGCKGVGPFTEGADLPNLATMTQAMCHTRWATQGARTLENSHPFWIGDIIGAHNGVIHNVNYLESMSMYPERKSFSVDSMHIFAHLNSANDLDELDGYGAVEYMDLETAWAEREVGLFVFNHSDLHVASIPDFGCVWSSSLTHLKRALELARVTNAKHYKDLSDGKLYFATPTELFLSKQQLVSPTTSNNYTSSNSYGHRSKVTHYSPSSGGKDSTQNGDGRRSSPTGTEALSNRGNRAIEYSINDDRVWSCPDCGVYYEEEIEELGICWSCGEQMNSLCVLQLLSNSPDKSPFLSRCPSSSPGMINGWINASIVLKIDQQTEKYHSGIKLALEELASVDGTNADDVTRLKRRIRKARKRLRKMTSRKGGR